MLKQKYFLTGIFILSAERQPIKLAWRKIVWLQMKSKGIPCSVPDRCAAAEEIEDGVTGFVFKTGDIHSLKQAIMKYEKADILTLQKNILSTFNADDYTPNTHTRNLLNIYSEILNN